MSTSEIREALEATKGDVVAAARLVMASPKFQKGLSKLEERVHRAFDKQKDVKMGDQFSSMRGRKLDTTGVSATEEDIDDLVLALEGSVVGDRRAKFQVTDIDLPADPRFEQFRGGRGRSGSFAKYVRP